MKTKILAVCTLIFMANIILGYFAYSAVQDFSESIAPPERLSIDGLVETPLNLSYSELADLPQVSEIAELQCIGTGQGGESVIYNWTGVPLFCILSLAQVKSGPNLLVVFRAVDGFVSNITLETAMKPTTLLGLKANGTSLNELTGFGSGTQIVLPCTWGYKWVRWVYRITVVDGAGSTCNEGVRPNCTMPTTNPPTQIFNIIPSYASNSTEQQIQIFSYASITYTDFKSDINLIFNVAPSAINNALFYITFPADLLSKSITVKFDNRHVTFTTIRSTRLVHIVALLTSNSDPATLEVRGSYTELILQSLGPHLTEQGVEYYNIHLREHTIHLVSSYP